MLSIYADDDNHLVSENTDLELGDELFRIQDRAVMVINIYKNIRKQYGGAGCLRVERRAVFSAK